MRVDGTGAQMFGDEHATLHQSKMGGVFFVSAMVWRGEDPPVHTCIAKTQGFTLDAALAAMEDERRRMNGYD